MESNNGIKLPIIAGLAVVIILVVAVLPAVSCGLHGGNNWDLTSAITYLNNAGYTAWATGTLTPGGVPVAQIDGTLATDSGLTYNSGTDTLTTTNLVATNLSVVDGVYLDTVNGVAGTTGTIGSSTNPVNNFTDAKTILSAKKLSSLYLKAEDYTCTENLTDLQIVGFWGGGASAITSFDLNSKVYTRCVFKNLNLVGTGSSGDSYGVTNDLIRTVDCAFYSGAVFDRLDAYNCLIDEVSAKVGFFYNCYGEGTNLFGNITAINYFVNFSGNMAIYNTNLNSGVPFTPSFIFTNGGGNIFADVSCDKGILTVMGNGFNINTIDAVGMTVNDFTGNNQSEKAINVINAASETNVLYLHNATGITKFKVHDLVLKCANPNPNTIIIRLYKLVNGILTVTNSFVVSSAGVLVRGVSSGYANYLSLDDMFTRSELSGDEIKITVQPSSGTCTIIGSYVVSAIGGT